MGEKAVQETRVASPLVATVGVVQLVMIGRLSASASAASGVNEVVIVGPFLEGGVEMFERGVAAATGVGGGADAEEGKGEGGEASEEGPDLGQGDEEVVQGITPGRWRKKEAAQPSCGQGKGR